MAQFVNLYWNNRSVVVHRSTALGEKTGPIFLLLVGLYGRLADKIWVDLEIFKFSTG